MAQHTTGRPGAPALIEGTIPLPGLAQLRSKSYLAQLYAGRHLSARQIARLTKTNRSVVLAALRKCGISKNGHNRTHPGQLPFGYDYQDYRLVKNQAEQGVIRLMGRAQAEGLSLRQIAGQLNPEWGAMASWSRPERLSYLNERLWSFPYPFFRPVNINRLLCVEPKLRRGCESRG